MKEKLVFPILPYCHILSHRSVTLKRELGREAEIRRSMSTINKSQHIKCNLGGQMSYPPTPSKMVGKLFPVDQESEYFWLCGKQAFVTILPKQHKSSHRQQLLQLTLLVTTTQLGKQKSLRNCLHQPDLQACPWRRTQLVLSDRSPSRVTASLGR